MISHPYIHHDHRSQSTKTDRGAVQADNAVPSSLFGVRPIQSLAEVRTATVSNYKRQNDQDKTEEWPHSTMTVYSINGQGQRVSPSQPETPAYSIPQDTTWNDPSNRRLRVITIGAGFSGILMAYQVQKQCQNMDHVVYEKNSDIGGWSPCPFPSGL